MRGVAWELERTLEANAARFGGSRRGAGSGQNFLADPNLLDAIVRDSASSPTTWCSRSAPVRAF